MDSEIEFTRKYNKIKEEDDIYNSLIRVTSYNILADCLIGSSIEGITDPDLLERLKWENRRSNLLSEIANLNSDILCLQEFEKDKKFIEELEKQGYEVYSLDPDVLETKNRFS